MFAGEAVDRDTSEHDETRQPLNEPPAALMPNDSEKQQQVTANEQQKCCLCCNLPGGFVQKWQASIRRLPTVCFCLMILFTIGIRLYLSALLCNLRFMESILTSENTLLPFAVCVIIETLLEVILAGMILIFTRHKMTRTLQRYFLYAIYFMLVIMLIISGLFLAWFVSTSPLNSIRVGDEDFLHALAERDGTWIKCKQQLDCTIVQERAQFRRSSLVCVAAISLIYYIGLAVYLLFASQLGSLLDLCAALDLWNYTSAAMVMISFASSLLTQANPVRIALRSFASQVDAIGWLVVGAGILLILAVLVLASVGIRLKLNRVHFSPIFALTSAAFLGGLVRVALQWNEQFLMYDQLVDFFQRNLANASSSLYQRAWDDIQQEFQCCGLRGPGDYAQQRGLPASCCLANASSACADYQNGSSMEGVYTSGCLANLPGFLLQFPFRVLLIFTCSTLFCQLTYVRSLAFNRKWSLYLAGGLHSLVVLLLIVVGVVGQEYVKQAASARTVFGTAGRSMVISGVLCFLQMCMILATMRWRKVWLNRMAFVCPVFISAMLLVLACRNLVNYHRGLTQFETLAWFNNTPYTSLDGSEKQSFRIFEAAAYWQMFTAFGCYAICLIYSSLWHDNMARRRPAPVIIDHTEASTIDDQ